METKKMLDKNGLEYYTGKIKQQIPKKTSDLTNDSDFITSATSRLTNYYTKIQADELLDDKVSKTGDTMNGDLTIQKDTPKLTLKATNTSDVKINIGNSNYSRDAILASNASVNGYNLMIDSGGRTIIGSGEGGLNLHNTLGKNQDSEVLYLVSDQQIFFDSNGQTIANRKGFELLNSGDLVPTVAGIATTDKGSLGTINYQWENVYSKVYHVDKQVAIEYNSTDRCIEFNFE